MIGKKPLDEIVNFEVNGVKCGYDGVFVWRIGDDKKEEFIGSFEDINLLETMPNCAVFYSDCLGEILSFDGDAFGGINEIEFEIVPEHREKDLRQMPEMWEQVRVKIDDDDIINKIGSDDDFHWGIESSCFLAQKDEYYSGTILLGICGCTCAGDDDILVDVDSSENYVSWKIYHDRNHSKKAIFLFEKELYKKAIENAKLKITKNEEDVLKWAEELFWYSKKDLLIKLKTK